ncbi:sensor histidine kinase [Hydrogenophaga soli]|nr:HAMP domain-containing sensor histidine kinase [Burkholderiaceae bacterium]
MALWQQLRFHWNRRSVQRVAALLSVVGCVLLFSLDAWVSYTHESAEIQALQDRALVRETKLLAAALSLGLAMPDRTVAAVPGASEPFVYRLSRSDGTWVSGNPDIAFLGLEDVQSSEEPNLYQGTFRGDRVRTAWLRVEGADPGLQGASYVLQVVEPSPARVYAQGSALARAMLNMVVRTLLTLMLMGFILWLTLRPLKALQDEVVEGGFQGESRLSEARPVELLPLVRALNELIDTQQQAAEREHKFLADASHQLRTPLAVMRTQLQGLSAGQLELGDTLPKMLRTVDRATSLANQLLSLEKVRQLVRQSDWVPVDLSGVASDMALEMAPLMVRKRLDFSLDAVPVVVLSDSWMLGELVRNLLANAIHHSQNHASIGIAIRQLQGEAELIVWDHAGGVSESVQARLFEPFAAAAGGTGIGLGLAICREIAESMSASVDLFNRQKDGVVIGCDAVVRWPAALVQGSVGQQPPLSEAKHPC